MNLAEALRDAAAHKVDAPFVPDPDLGHVDEESRDVWRWSCGHCPARSVGTYPTFLAVWEGLRGHHDAAGSLHR